VEGYCSHRLGLCEHLSADSRRKGVRRQNIHRDAQELTKLEAHRSEIHQGGLCRRVDEQVEITPIPVLIPYNGSEDSRIHPVMCRDE
jgi:hypothetical protein